MDAVTRVQVTVRDSSLEAVLGDLGPAVVVRRADGVDTADADADDADEPTRSDLVDVLVTEVKVPQPEVALDQIRGRVRQTLEQDLATLHGPGVMVVLSCVSFDPRPPETGTLGRPSMVTRRASTANLAAVDLAIDEDISLIDCDRVLAELGADAHLHHDGSRSTTFDARVREEIIAVLRDRGLVGEPVEGAPRP
jgi:hypothetical protein